MKVVLTQPALAEGAAEACPAFRTAASSLFIGMLRGAFSLIYRHRIHLLLLCLVAVFIALPHSGHAQDLLINQKQDAKDTFGHGSTVEWGLYIAEVIVSAGLYMKTRNPMLFVGGLAFLVVITRSFFALAG